MNYKNILKATVLSALMLSGTACQEFLDKEPLDAQVENNFYQTEDDAMAALFSVYDVLQWNTLPGLQGGFHPFPMISDIASDDAYAGGGDRSDGAKMYQFDRHEINSTVPEVYGLWAKSYRGIYRANLFLEKIEGMTASDEFVKRSVAEVKFLRAYFYFQVARPFGKAPLILKTLEPSEYIQPLAAPEEVFNQIALDLNQAIPNLPQERVSAAESGRVSKYAAEALLAKTFLFYKGFYGKDLKAGETTINAQKAIDMLEDVINNSGHDLLADYGDVFKMENEFSIESVFEIAYSDTKLGDWTCVECGEGNIMAQMVGPRLQQPELNAYHAGWSFSIPTQELVDAFETDDPRRDATILFEDELEGGVTTGFQHTGYYSQKYAPGKEYPEAGDVALHRGNNVRVIRFSDVLLMAAELHVAHGGDAGLAQNYLDRVRSRAGLASVPATEENIFAERRVELALEGHRYWDLLRRGATVAQQELSTVGPRGANFVGENSDFEIDASAITRTKGLFPIPQRELGQMNGEWTQNDGY